MCLKVGQVLWLKLQFGRTDNLSRVYHPYLILDINDYGIRVVEIGQLDSKKGRPWELLNHLILVDDKNPDETVIYQTSYLQSDRKIQIEYFDELSQYLDVKDTLSQKKLDRIINGYYNARNKFGSDDFKDMYFRKEEVLSLNPIEEWEDARQRRIEKYKKN